MIKKTKGNSINIVSVLVILMCLFVSCVGVSNAWFTSTHDKGVEIIVDVGDLKLSLYQKIETNYVKIFNNKENLTATTKSYVQLNETISPEEDIDLNLKLANEDPGSVSMYVRFKFEVFTRGVSADSLLDCEIEGYDVPEATKNGFTYKDGYYYYTDNTGENVHFAKGTSAVLMQKFNIAYENFAYENGDFKLIDSNTIYIKLTIMASVSKTFA